MRLRIVPMSCVVLGIGRECTVVGKELSIALVVLGCSVVEVDGMGAMVVGSGRITRSLVVIALVKSWNCTVV